MCVSSTSSLTLFLTGTICSFILAYRYQDVKYFSFAVVSLMQMSEWLMWIDIENQGKYNNLNILGNYIAILSLFLQTSVMTLLKPTREGYYLMIIQIILYTILTYNYMKKQYLSEKAKSNKLSWGIMKANNSTFLRFLAFMFVISQTFVNIVYFNKKSIEFSFVNYFILFLSIKATSPNVIDFSSLWCYMGALIVFVYTVFKVLFM